MAMLVWRSRLHPAGIALTVLAVPLALMVGVTTAQAATTRFVDVNNPSCSDSGPGSQSTPFCTIIRASQVAIAGDTVLVSAGTYVGEVVPTNSGTAAAPITYAAEPGETVVVRGGNRGFAIRSKSWITIAGFQITDTLDNGIYLKSATSITVRDNHVFSVGEPGSSSTTAQGIYLTGTKDSTITGNTVDHNSDSGIYVTTGNSGIQIIGNASFANARGYTRAATGIDVRSPGNTVVGNRAYNNEDSGIQLYNGANATKVYNNVVYANGDHGIDVLNSTDTVIVSNTVYDNVTAGINLEGTSGTPASSRGTLRNNVTVDNGLSSTATRGNVRVDDRSLSGTTLNQDLVHLSRTGTMFTWGTSLFGSLSALQAATGQELRGIEADPLWVAPGAGDFHLRTGSPAIDSADSAAPSQPATDIEGTARIDDPAVANTGIGPRTYDDRGAFEHKPGPAAALTVDPESAPAPVTVRADASGSFSPVGIASYAFTFGDGSAGTGPQSSPVTTHTYSAVGTYDLTVTVTDTAGQQATAGVQVRATATDEPPTAALTLTPSSGDAPLDVTADASGSTDPDVTPIDKYTFDFGDGTVVGPQSAPMAAHTYPTPGSYTVTVTVADTGGQRGSASQTITVIDPNLVGNPGFETSTSGWNASGRAGVTISRVAGGHSGGWAAQVANTNATTVSDCTLNDAPNWVATTQPGNYHAALWIRNDQPGHVVKLRLREYNGSTFVGSSPIVSDTAGSTWSQLTVDLTIQAPGSTLDLTAYETNAAPGTCFIADDVSISHQKPAPTAALTVTPSSGLAPLTVQADASGSTSPIGIASYAFTFGDGSAGTGPQASPMVSHTYSAAGTYDLTVTVTDTDGQQSSVTTQVLAKSSDEPPTANLTVAPSTGLAPLDVTADASGSTDPDVTPIATYTFDFGDGIVVGPQAAATATHRYPNPGSYTVTVTVTDTGGKSGTTSLTVLAQDPNLVGNSGFETSTSGWNVGGRAGVTLTRVAGGHSGNWAAQLANTNATTVSDCTLNDAPNWVTVSTAGTYRASLWVRNDDPGRVVKLRLREYNGSTFVGSSPVVSLTAGPAWAQLSVDLTVQVPGSTLDLTAYVSNAPPGTCFLADDISILRL